MRLSHAGKQVHEILDAIRGVHRQLADHYRDFEEVVADERLQLLLEDMERRELSFDDCVAQYEANEDSEALGTWLQFVPDEAVHVDHLSERLAEPRTMEDLAEETLTAEQQAVRRLSRDGQGGSNPELKDLFTDLAKMEERNDCHYVTTLLEDL